MDLDKYKQELTDEILTLFSENGVRETLRKTGINSKIWYDIKHGNVKHAETLEKHLELVKKCLNVLPESKQ